MARRTLTYEGVAELLDYNPDTGNLVWKQRVANRVHEGDIAGYINTRGYRVIRVGGKQRYAHRLAWLLHYGKWPDKQIDHIDHDPSNNRIGNLRISTQEENTKNASLRTDNTSGICGVFWDKTRNKWAATVQIEKKTKHLGRFESLHQAVAIRCAAAKEMGYHENHGRSEV